MKTLNREVKTHILDAKDQILGRIATQAAILLRGKHKNSYQPNQVNGDKVVIINAEKIKVSGSKLDQKKYYRHSGYPGSLKEITLRNMVEKRPEEVVIRAIKGMLPDNRLRSQILKNLTVRAGDND